MCWITWNLYRIMKLYLRLSSQRVSSEFKLPRCVVNKIFLQVVFDSDKTSKCLLMVQITPPIYRISYRILWLQMLCLKGHDYIQDVPRLCHIEEKYLVDKRNSTERRVHFYSKTSYIFKWVKSTDVVIAETIFLTTQARRVSNSSISHWRFWNSLTRTSQAGAVETRPTDKQNAIASKLPRPEFTNNRILGETFR